ncbi:hypothetical protein RDV64_02360 [Acuticoccus sp. MNP-M23]|uniref:hypothetical protein n=1 Tax=Acuticoccus sp. MNP-M23 TaxID=3072793 RepID=UPI0028163E06|nr:hypothetical protein [Acuticoccus sp. MNP-M23]WMS43267.1 hypothetical protein RDV64_02360 [Acuticoccus sp. MNP-M23]
MKRAALAIALALAAPAAAAEACFAPLAPGIVSGADGYLSVTLEDGREVRIGGIVPATTTSVGEDLPSLDLAALAGRRVAVRAMADAPQADRYGRIIGDIVLEDTGPGLLDGWLREGLALVDPTGMSEACLEVLFTAERAAEMEQRGFWARPDGVRSAANPALSSEAGAFALVSGLVKSVGETRSTVYLNFGEDYDSDFTVLVRRSDARGWDSELADLAGTQIRVRGVLEAWNGGLIRLEHPRQVERLRADRALRGLRSP